MTRHEGTYAIVNRHCIATELSKCVIHDTERQRYVVMLSECCGTLPSNEEGCILVHMAQSESADDGRLYSIFEDLQFIQRLTGQSKSQQTI